MKCVWRERPGKGRLHGFSDASFLLACLSCVPSIVLPCILETMIFFDLLTTEYISVEILEEF